VKYAMKDHPVQFLLKGYALLPRIIHYPVDTDIDLPFYRLPGFGQVEGDDVGIIVVLEEVAVHLQQVVICTKDIGKGRKGFTGRLEHLFQELFEPVPVTEGKPDIVIKELYRHEAYF
jgi:hypothetical protein